MPKESKELSAARRSAYKAWAASRERDHAIRAAHAAGNSIRTIAVATSLSASRVHQILHKERHAETSC